MVATDPERGSLRKVVNQLGLASFSVPPAVGGRFSVLTSVGLLPAAAAGLDVMGFLDGAAAMRDRIAQERDLWKNPALLLAAALHLHDRDRQRPIHVFPPTPISCGTPRSGSSSCGRKVSARPRTRTGKPSTPVRRRFPGGRDRPACPGAALHRRARDKVTCSSQWPTRRRSGDSRGLIPDNRAKWLSRRSQHARVARRRAARHAWHSRRTARPSGRITFRASTRSPWAATHPAHSRDAFAGELSTSNASISPGSRQANRLFRAVGPRGVLRQRSEPPARAPRWVLVALSAPASLPPFKTVGGRPKFMSANRQLPKPPGSRDTGIACRSDPAASGEKTVVTMIAPRSPTNRRQGRPVWWRYP